MLCLQAYKGQALSGPNLLSNICIVSRSYKMSYFVSSFSFICKWTKDNIGTFHHCCYSCYFCLACPPPPPPPARYFKNCLIRTVLALMPSSAKCNWTSKKIHQQKRKKCLWSRRYFENNLNFMYNKICILLPTWSYMHYPGWAYKIGLF